MTRRVEVTFTADEMAVGEYKIHDSHNGDITIYLHPDRDEVDVVEVPREYRLGQIYKVHSNTTFDPNGYGFWVVIRDRSFLSEDRVKFACPGSGNVYDKCTWETFIDGRTVELVSEEYVH